MQGRLIHYDKSGKPFWSVRVRWHRNFDARGINKLAEKITRRLTS